MDEQNTTQAEQTQEVQGTNEENALANENVQTNEETNPEVSTENSGNEDGAITDVVETENVTPTKEELTPEQMRARLDEYQLRDEEDAILRQRLGIPDNVDQRTFDLMNMDQQIVNIGSQEYLKLCNEYGVSSDLREIDSSVEKLKETDPKKAYEFIRRVEDLTHAVSSRRGAVQQQASNYEIARFGAQYRPLLEASPALNNIIREYVGANYGSCSMYQQLENVMGIILPAYQEAFEAGKKLALSDRAKTDTTSVSGGAVTSNTQTYSQGQTFTRQDIARMSTEEFAKNESAIRQMMREGRI